jgi:hypothetical protein
VYPNWLQKDVIDPNILSNPFLKIGFSQNGEDDFIRGFFWKKILAKELGVYIDIGCYHESLYSNTKLLNLVGWRGIAVDANPDSCSLWLSQRPHDKFLNYAIKKTSDDAKSIDLYRFQDGAINTIDSKIAQDWQQKGFKLIDRINVPALSISQLALEMIKECMAPPDFVNIDIEFVDYLDDLPVFLDILQYPPLLCLEWITQNMSFNNYKESKEYLILSSQGYEINGFIGGNIFAKNMRSLSNDIIKF